MRVCIVCGKPRSIRARFYCDSKECKHTGRHTNKHLIRQKETEEFLAGSLNAMGRNGRDRAGLVEWARQLLLEEANWACTQCGWSIPHPRTGKPPLEVDHIDGNRNNNFRNNLRILCPNCHSLTETYRRGNLGNSHSF